MNIGVIGVGNMARSLINGFLRSKENKILCSDSNPKQLKIFQKKSRVKIAQDNISVVNSSKIIFLCVKPFVVGEVLREIKDNLTEKKILVSIAAGVQSSYIEKNTFKDIKIIRAMPNLPCSVLKGVFGFKPNRNCKTSDIKAFLKLVETVGIGLKVKSEKDFDYVTALSGSGPAFLAEYISAQMDYARSVGMNSALAKDLIFETIIGTVEYLNHNNIKPSNFVKLVSSPGGTTEAGMKILKSKKFINTIYKSLNVASNKSREISKKINLKRD